MASLSDNDKFKIDLIRRVTERMPEVEQAVLDELFRLMDSINSAGGNFDVRTLSTDQLLSFTQAIRTTLQTSGYNKDVGLFLSDYGKITINSSDILKNVGGFDVSTLQLSDVEKKWKLLTSETLLNSGIRTDFETPILKILDESISYGGSIERAKKRLTEFIVGGKDTSGKLKSYVTQTARDSVGQLQGQQFHSVANAIDTAGIRYIGSVLKDSRGQCEHWVRDLNGFIPWSDLQEEIKQTYINQAAKKVDVVNGVRHQWGGFMPNTTPANFMAKRGGYNCTHTAVPVRKKPNSK
jgi:hypothetical protein